MKINPEAQLAVKLWKARPLMKDQEPPFKNIEEQVLHDAARLMSMARALSRLDTHACNRELTERENKRIGSLVSGVNELLRGYGLNWHHNTDPRGYAVKIMFPDGSYNTMGGREDGWGI